MMADITIRDLSRAARDALALRSIANNRKPEDEVRAILEEVLCPARQLHVGSILSGLSRASGLSNTDVEALAQARRVDPALPMWFG